MQLLRALKIITAPALPPPFELLAVLGLFGSFYVMVVGLFAGGTGDRMDAANVYCHIQVGRLAQGLERYRADCGRYPDARAGLRSLVEDDTMAGWRGPYIKEVPRDPWGRPFLYLQSGGASEPEIVSYGADGKPGGESDDADVSSRHLDRQISETPFETRALWLMPGIWMGAWVCFVGFIVALRKMSRRRNKPSHTECS